MKTVIKLDFLLLAISFGMLNSSCTYEKEKEIVVQAHRGGAALYPENTIPAMLNAVSIGVTTLELDLQVTRDSQVVVSHDSYLNSNKVLYPNGNQIPTEKEQALQLFSMDYDYISKFDIGTLKTVQFPRRKNLHCAIPTLTNLIDCVETYACSRGRKQINYNIEIKSGIEKDGRITPDYKTFCDLTMQVLSQKTLNDRLCIQSFDSRALNYIRQKYPSVQLSYLVDETHRSVREILNDLDFIPDIISPIYSIVDANFVIDAHHNNMKVIPWTVDAEEEVLRLKMIGVDEIITNQPDSVQTWLANDSQRTKYVHAVKFFENLMGY